MIDKHNRSDLGEARGTKAPHGGKVAYSVEEACSMSGLRRTTIYKAMKLGELLFIKVGARTLILHVDLLNYLESKRVGRPTRLAA